MTGSRSRRRYLQLSAATLSAVLAGCPSRGPDQGSNQDTDDGPDFWPPWTKKVDDWQYDPGQGTGTGPGGTSTPMATVQAARAAESDVGLAVGGAKDIANYRDNVEEGYLPIPSDLSYEGLFYEYYFDTGGDGSCSRLFCPAYSPAVTADPLSGETERYLTVGLNSGLDAGSFERKRLNLAVVLDISGSMDAAFDEYYYDRYGNRKQVEDYTGRPKIDVATDAVASLTTNLRADDRFGMVVFNDSAAVAKPMRLVGKTDMDAIRGHVQELRAGGGTNMAAGLDAATDLLAAYDDVDRTQAETRMIVLTDAMPNIGTRSEGGLRGVLEENAANHLYTTFVGIGVDFNTEIIDAITAVEGANYYSVHSAKQFERRLDDEFAYMVTPLVFDLTLQLEAAGYDIRKVYGSTDAEEATGEIFHVNTLFPSPTREGKTRGGVILAGLRRTSGSSSLRLSADWETRAGKRRRASTEIQFPASEPPEFANTGVRKAVLLSRYADLMKQWMIDERTGDSPEEGVEAPDESELGKWERQSTPLTVSEPYRRRFREFADHFEAEMQAVGDDTLQQELDILRKLANYEG